MSEREMTAAEKRWWKLFKDIIKEMPSTLEISVYNSSIDVCEQGARQAAFERDSHSDNTPNLDFFKANRVYPNGEAL